MAMVDNGVIIWSDSTWIKVLPRCPYCGYAEPNGSWNEVYMGIPKIQHSTTTSSCSCKKCGKNFKITAYPG